MTIYNIIVIPHRMIQTEPKSDLKKGTTWPVKGPPNLWRRASM